MRFVVAQLAVVVSWIVFEPIPRQWLTLAVSVEAVLLTSFVLMSQNRMTRRADRRDHLALQIALLSEQELTKLLQLQRLVCRRLDISEADHEEELDHLSQETAVDHLAEELEARLP
jgi:uncharacterized membrane protein